MHLDQTLFKAHCRAGRSYILNKDVYPCSYYEIATYSTLSKYLSNDPKDPENISHMAFPLFQVPVREPPTANEGNPARVSLSLFTLSNHASVASADDPRPEISLVQKSTQCVLGVVADSSVHLRYDHWRRLWVQANGRSFWEVDGYYPSPKKCFAALGQTFWVRGQSTICLEIQPAFLWMGPERAYGGMFRSLRKV